jgi:cytochrome P450
VDRLTRSLGTPIELHAPLQALTLSITADALFGIELGPDGEAMRHLARCYTDRLAQPTLLDFLLPENWISPKDFQRRRFRRRWMALIERIVAERRRIRLETPDMFELLARSETEPGRFEQQVATMLITGSETSGAALFWAIYLVAAAPEIQALIAAEAAAASLDTADAAAVLPSLVHTQAVVQEAMRLYPPALSIVRQAREADMADGIPIPAGAIVEVAPYVLHRHRKYWAEPDRFDPSRFLPGAPPPERHTYLPFGVGPRICIGAQFALAETVLILATLIRRFRIEPTSDRPVGLVTRITLQPENPLPFRLSLRPEEAPAAPQMLDRPDQRPARCPVAGAL